MDNNIKWEWIKAKDFIDFNPKEVMQKGIISKKIAMDKLEPHSKEIIGYDNEPFNGGTKFKNGDTLMARITPCLENGKIAYVDFLDDDELAFGSTEFIVLREKENISDKNFIYYLAISDFFKKPAEKSMVGSSGRQRVQTNVLKELEIKVPDLNTQKKISSILSYFDNLIKLNKKINHNLEELLMLIYKNWFEKFECYDKSRGMIIDSDFGEIPKYWDVERLDQFVDFVAGVEPGSKNYHENPFENSIPFLRVGDLGNKDNTVFIEKDLSKNRILSPEDIVLSMDATIGIVKIGLNGAYSTGMRKLVIKEDKINKPFLYCLVKSNRIQKIIETYATGTTILHAGKSIKHMTFVLPEKEMMDKFNLIGDPILSIILKNIKEIEKLTQLRDILLPKLMSGEIDVSNIDI